MDSLKDFTPTAEQISLHGLGFIQIKLAGNRRMHVWHPFLPRRSCFARSAIHNHRFSFRSTVLIGHQVNRRFAVMPDLNGSHDLISHDGPRSPKGGRLSYVAGRVAAWPLPIEIYAPGQSYFMPELQYHETANDGVVVTIMEKVSEGGIHASSLIEHGHEFDQSFDRFQLSETELWGFVIEAFQQGGRG